MMLNDLFLVLILIFLGFKRFYTSFNAIHSQNLSTFQRFPKILDLIWGLLAASLLFLFFILIFHLNLFFHLYRVFLTIVFYIYLFLGFFQFFIGIIHFLFFVILNTTLIYNGR
jgi:hypothetical protein